MRIPLALKNANFRTVITAWAPSWPNQVFPDPSAPAGHNISVMLLNPASVLDAAAEISASLRGTGTSEEENGVAPAEKGTLGLLVSFNVTEPLPKVARNEPENSKLDCEALGVMDKTSPVSPPNGGADQDLDCVFQIATADAGEVKLPPTQTLFWVLSQYIALTSLLGPFEPRDEKALAEGSYDATLVAEAPPTEEKLPAI